MLSTKQLSIQTKYAFYLNNICKAKINCLINVNETRFYHNTGRKCLLSTRNDCYRLSTISVTQSKQCSLARHHSTDIKPAPNQNANVENTVKKKKAFVGIAGIERDVDISKLDTEWKRVYLCPFILIARAVCRFKLYQTVLMCASVPVVGSMCLMGIVTVEKFQILCILSFLAFSVLFSLGQVFRRLVGAVYISECGKRAKIARLTFFGNRRDEFMNISDIVPLIENNYDLKDFYCTIERLSANDKLFMSLKFGGVLDQEGFDAIFGKDPTNSII